MSEKAFRKQKVSVYVGKINELLSDKTQTCYYCWAEQMEKQAGKHTANGP